MSEQVGAEAFGRSVLGPVVGEFCLRLWLLGSMLDRPDDTALLFCARGGLRMQLAYEHFLESTGTKSAVHLAPLMVSRVVAMRAALATGADRTAEEGLPDATARTLVHEFSGVTVREAMQAISGVPLEDGAGRWDVLTTPARVHALLLSEDGAQVVAALRDQTDLFRLHLEDALGARRHAVLVDTGLHGTTAALLGEALPDLVLSSALMVSYYPPARNVRPPRTFGLTLEATGYAPWRRRSVLLRYWHLVEGLFEPDLPSVRRFEDVGGVAWSNLEVDGWASRVAPEPGTMFAGVLGYLDDLPRGAARTVVTDARPAWRTLHRTVVVPGRQEAEALVVNDRSHDFGRDDTFSARPWRGLVPALRGAAMWREGEIARSGTPLRLPALLAIEAAYGLRSVSRVFARGGRGSK